MGWTTSHAVGSGRDTPAQSRRPGSRPPRVSTCRQTPESTDGRGSLGDVREAAGCRPRRRSVLARIQLAPALATAEKQGRWTDRARHLPTSNAAGLATGEEQVRRGGRSEPAGPPLRAQSEARPPRPTRAMQSRERRACADPAAAVDGRRLRELRDWRRAGRSDGRRRDLVSRGPGHLLPRTRTETGGAVSVPVTLLGRARFCGDGVAYAYADHRWPGLRRQRGWMR